ncbi:MAG: Hsp20/alpha crystallin family protein [Pseudomonadota bacterium]
MANSFLDLFGRPGSVASDPFADMRRDFDRMLDSWRGGQPLTTGFAPALDVTETESGVRVAAELPGLSEEDVALELHEDVLTISGEKKAETEKTDEKTGAVLRERSYGSFRRALRLPWVPEGDGVQARFENGVLTVELTRPAEIAPKTRRIAIG